MGILYSICYVSLPKGTLDSPTHPLDPPTDLESPTTVIAGGGIGRCMARPGRASSTKVRICMTIGGQKSGWIDGPLKYLIPYLWGSNWCKCRVSLRDVLLRMYCWGWKYNTPCSPCDRFTTLWKLRWKLKTNPSENLHVQVPCYFSGSIWDPKLSMEESKLQTRCAKLLKSQIIILGIQRYPLPKCHPPQVVVSNMFNFHPTWGDDPIWLMFFKGVETAD